MATNKLLPGQKIVISYSSKGYAVSIAGKKAADANGKTQYYADLALLLDYNSLSAVGISSSGTITAVSGAVGKLPSSKNKNKTQLELAGYYDSVRPYNESVMSRVEFPGYKNAYLEFVNIYDPTKIKVVGFMVSPSAISCSMANSQQITKTMAGWQIMRTGKNMQQVNLTGYMLDTKDCQERNDFIEYYKTYIEDRKNANNEYVNEWAVNLIVEGRKYIGFMQSLNIQKSSVQPFLYQYSIAYISLNDILIFQSAKAIANKRKMAPLSFSAANSIGNKATTTIGDSLSGLLGLSN